MGNFTAGNTCMTTGGSCSVNTTSTSAGADTMRASTMVAVGCTTANGPVLLSRATGTASPGHVNGDDATKKWANDRWRRTSAGCRIAM